MEAPSLQTAPTYTRDEYLKLDAAAENVKFEYDGYQIYAMAGASLEHNQIAGNIHTELNSRLRPRGCRVTQSDLRVRLETKYVYPDVVALCGEPELTEENPPSLLNPELIVEVESGSTSERDRGWKLDSYLELSSLKECWIVESHATRVMQYARQGELWTLRLLSGLEATIRGETFDVEIALTDLYALVFE